MIAPADVALGILAGGRGERLGGRDKAWLPRGGRPALDTLLQALPDAAGFGQRLASVRVADERWLARGFECVPDLHAGQPGPLAGLEALGAACRLSWLYVLPVDVSDLPADLFERLAAIAAPHGAWLRDASGLQPLVGLWPAARLHRAAGAAFDVGETAVFRALAGLAPAELDVSPLRLGNANTPGAYDVLP